MSSIAAVQNLTCLRTWPRQLTKVKAPRQERCCSWSLSSPLTGTKRSNFCARVRQRQHRVHSSPKAAVSDQGPANCGPSIPERLIAASLYVWPVCEGAWRLVAGFQSWFASQTIAEWFPEGDAAVRLAVVFARIVQYHTLDWMIWINMHAKDFKDQVRICSETDSKRTSTCLKLRCTSKSVAGSFADCHTRLPGALSRSWSLVKGADASRL